LYQAWFRRLENEANYHIMVCALSESLTEALSDMATVEKLGPARTRLHNFAIAPTEVTPAGAVQDWARVAPEGNTLHAADFDMNALWK
jgi:hypothetical protein